VSMVWSVGLTALIMDAMFTFVVCCRRYTSSVVVVFGCFCSIFIL